MTLEVYLAFLATLAVFFAAPPGPSQALLIATSLRHGLRRSTATIAGDLCANALQMSAAAFGLAAILASSAWSIVLLKWAGVVYLAWLGWRQVRAASRPGMRAPREAVEAPARLWRQGFLTSAANPKAIFFFAALFPQFIDPAAPVAPQLLLLGATYLLVDGLLLLAWGAAAGRLRAWLAVRERWLQRISGVAMIMAAAVLALRDPDPPPARAR